MKRLIIVLMCLFFATPLCTAEDNGPKNASSLRAIATNFRHLADRISTSLPGEHGILLSLEVKHSARILLFMIDRATEPQLTEILKTFSTQKRVAAESLTKALGIHFKEFSKCLSKKTQWPLARTTALEIADTLTRLSIEIEVLINQDIRERALSRLAERTTPLKLTETSLTWTRGIHYLLSEKGTSTTTIPGVPADELTMLRTFTSEVVGPQKVEVMDAHETLALIKFLQRILDNVDPKKTLTKTQIRLLASIEQLLHAIEDDAIRNQTEKPTEPGLKQAAASVQQKIARIPKKQLPNFRDAMNRIAIEISLKHKTPSLVTKAGLKAVMLEFFDRDVVERIKLDSLTTALKSVKGEWWSVQNIRPKVEIILRRVATEAKKGGR